MFQTKQNREKMKPTLIVFLRLAIVLRTTPAQCGGVAVNQRHQPDCCLPVLKLLYFVPLKLLFWAWQPQEFLASVSISLCSLPPHPMHPVS